MNGLSRAIARFTAANAIKLPFKVNNFGKREFTRTLWHMCSKTENSGNITANATKLLNQTSLACNCGCNTRNVHSKGERELVEFLNEEIVAEKKAQKIKGIPTEFEGFKVKLDGADVELHKDSDKEKLSIYFNVNHTVDADDEAEIDPQADKPNFAEMKSRPQFEVDIKRGNTTLSFTCSYLQGSANEGEYNDIFGIDEVTIYNGEWNDKVYAVAGDVLDGYLYDLLMNLLEEKGISNEFAEKLSELSTAYEHSCYIGLLEGVSKFTSGK